MLCQGITSKKRPCQNKVNGQNKYCRYHGEPIKSEIKPVAIKPVIINNSNNGRPPIPIISNRPIKMQKENCSICLCEVEADEDCNLICGHAHHVECISKLFKPECPVCRAPLQFKQKGIIDNIKIRELKDKEEEKIKTIEEDIRFAQTLQQDNEVLQASLLQEEMDEYERIARATEESFLYHQSYEEQLLKEVMINSIVQPTEKELLFHYLEQIFDGKERIIVSLNHR